MVWCWLFIEETIVLFYTLQFWNIIGKLSKWKSKFEYWYWMQKGNRSWKNIILKLHFHSNLHRFNRAMLSITEKKKKKKNHYSRALLDFHCKIELPLITHAILIKASRHILMTIPHDYNVSRSESGFKCGLNDVKHGCKNRTITFEPWSYRV